MLPGYYLLFVGCQSFPEPAKTEPLPQGLQSLRQTNNTQPRHEIRPTEELGATSGIGATLLSGESSGSWKSWGSYKCSDPRSERSGHSKGRRGAPKKGAQTQVEARGLRMVWEVGGNEIRFTGWDSRQRRRVGGEVLLNGWGRPRDVISCCVREHWCQNTSCGKTEPPEVPNDWEFNQRGRGAWSSVIPYVEMLLLHGNWSIPSINQTAKKKASVWHGRTLQDNVWSCIPLLGEAQLSQRALRTLSFTHDLFP